MCEHILPIEKYIQGKDIRETYRGEAWSYNCREWVYFDCILDVEQLQARFKLPDFVTIHENKDPKSGTELGLVCNQCQDAIMGLHPHFSKGKVVG